MLPFEPAGDGLGGQELLKGQVPEAHLVAAPHDDPAVDLFLIQKPLGPLDGVLVNLAVADLGGDSLGRPALGRLRLAPFRIVLHGQGQFLEHDHGPLGRGPAQALLAGARQPADDRLV